MTSSTELTKAYDDERRRLVTAFVSGAAVGGEVRPVRLGRTMAAGVVLAALLVAGAAAARVWSVAPGAEQAGQPRSTTVQTER